MIVREVVMKDGSVRRPALFEELTRDPHGIITMLSAGVSTRDVGKVIAAVTGSPAPEGTSSSSVSRIEIDVEDRYRTELEKRPLGPKKVKLVTVDGTKIGDRTVMVATGYTAGGHKVALGACIAQHELADDIYPLLQKIVARGVDPRVLWTVDQGQGIREAIERISGPNANIQLCCVHFARKIFKHRQGEEPFSEELEDAVRKRMYQAWANDDAEQGLAEMAGLAAELKDGGRPRAARALLNEVERTFTLHRYGLSLGARKPLRTTNVAESVNSWIKKLMGNVSYFRNDEMRLRWTAFGLFDLETTRWSRLAHPEALVTLSAKLMPERHDLDAIWKNLPPNLEVEKLAAPAGGDAALGRFSADWCLAGEGGSWAGSEAALAHFGVAPGQALTVADVGLGLQGRDAGSGEQRGEQRRRLSKVTVERLEGGELTKVKADGVIDLKWELTAPPFTTDEWHDADATRREEIRRALVNSASTALEHLTSTTQPNHGFAATVTFVEPPRDGREPPRVRGVILGLARGTGAKLTSPSTQSAVRGKTARRAEDAAKEVIDRALGPSRRPRRAETAATPTSDLAESLPDRREPPSEAVLTGVAERALEISPRICELSPAELRKAADQLESARDDLALVGPEVDAWWQAQREAAAQQLALERAAMQPPPPAQKPWLPLDRRARIVLGEERAQELLGAAAYQRGLLGPVSPEGVRKLDGQSLRQLAKQVGTPLGGLRLPLERIERFAVATAATWELERSQLFAAPPGPTEPEPEVAPPLPVRDRSGRPVADPIDRYARALGARADPLRRRSDAVEISVAEASDRDLDSLATAIGDPWRHLDPRTGIMMAGAERGRDVAVADFAKACRDQGEFELQARLAGDQTRRSEFNDRAAVAAGQAKRHWARLREIEADLAEYRTIERNPERFMREHPEAALQHAIQAEQLRRARDVAKETTPDIEQATPAAVPAIAPDLGRGI